MRILYDIFFLIFGILYIPVLLFKGKLHRDFSQKFGIIPAGIKVLDKPVWIHGVSVGEAALAAKLARSIKKDFPDVPVVVSTTTQTGNNMARKAGEGYVDAVFYYPMDVSGIVSRTVRDVDPRLYVMIETELWPNLMEELSAREVPAVLVNGRISNSSFRNYKKIRFFTRRILRCLDRLCMQSEVDLERVKELGALEDKVFVTGNMKFDGAVQGSSEKISPAKLGLNGQDPVIVAGSTHFPEEQLVVDIYRDLKNSIGALKLVIAPRHIERAEAIKIYVEKESLSCRRFSEISENPGEAGQFDVLLVDTIGHLKDIYGLATVVFIGGSMVRKGGQNPIEAACWGKPVVFGPNMFNFREVSEIFLQNGAAVKVDDNKQLKDELKELLEDAGKREEMSKKAMNVIEENSGTIERTMERIREYIGREVRDKG
ncbi:MAG: 3-deoxy-D-manno-octulosonic acid transferase [Candidatus Tantalella remota]|nr:3-deoxy-D-manno-octulosonic acid transferase [Candidatus Tantalella remota]